MSNNHNLKPPAFPTWLISQLGKSKYANNVLGDMEELFQRRVQEDGETSAKLHYWLDAFSVLINKAIPSEKSDRSLSSSIHLLANYFKIASRHLLRQKVHSGINIIGLSVGFTFSILILLFVVDETSYDRMHANTNRICLLPMTWNFNGTSMPTSANCSVGGPFMKEAFPEVEEYARVSMSSLSLRNGSDIVKEKRVYFADSSFLKIFSFPMLQGNPENALVNPYSMVLTRSMAVNYFGTNWEKENVLSKTIVASNNKAYQVTGIIEDVPANSHLQFNFLVSFSTLPISRVTPTWDNSQFYTYLLLNENADRRKIVHEVPTKLDARFGKETSRVISLGLIPLSDVYLHATQYKVPNSSDVIYVKIFSFTALLILVIAMVNYVNMATARSMERALEVGVRKVMGAQRRQLFFQFLNESIIVTTISFGIAIAFTWLLLPVFNAFTEKSLVFSSLLTIQNISLMVVVVTAISFLSGFYPAVFVSGYMPAKVLKGKLKDSVQGIRMRKALVVSQFLISILLLICTLMISDQINFIQSKSLGFNREQLVTISLDSLSRTRLEIIQSTFERESNVSGTAASFQLPTHITHQTALSLKTDTPDDRRLMNAVSVSSDFIKTIGLELITGQGFTQRIEQTSEIWEIVLNESAAAFFGWTPEESVGKEIIVWEKEGRVKGVVKDFHFSSLHQPISPLVIFSGKNATQYSNLIIRTTGTPEEIRNSFEVLWKRAAPDSPFLLTYLDDQYESLYKKETLLKQVVNIFAVLAIIISNLGLFGLASYLIVQRTKEMGIRKVLGATPAVLIKLVSKSFVQLVLVAFFLAIPVSWYLMNQWLSGFAYRIGFNWLMVFLAGAFVFLLALTTVVYHALQVTRINPAATLRSN